MVLLARSRPLARLLLAVTAALAIGSSWAPVSHTLAADDSNIPGIPLPGFVVTGQLGGPIYDHVYSVNVPPSSLVLLSLTGDAGTDFDLYLFDSGATTVYTTDGQVAASTGNSSTESITYPSPGGGRYYIDLNGASDVQGAFRLVVSIQSDSTPPVATIQLNGGAVATNVETVTVVVVGSDNLSGVSRMSLSTDGRTWGPWAPYSPTFLWEFPTGDGAKQLWARVEDRAGNVSNVATATIQLDTTAPQVLVRDPEPNGVAAGLQIHLPRHLRRAHPARDVAQRRPHRAAGRRDVDRRHVRLAAEHQYRRLHPVELDDRGRTAPRDARRGAGPGRKSCGATRDLDGDAAHSSRGLAVGLRPPWSSPEDRRPFMAGSTVRCSRR